MLRAQGFKQAPGIQARVEAKLAAKVNVPKQAQGESVPATGWRRSACRGQSRSEVAGQGVPGMLLGVQGHSHTMDAEDLLITSGAAYTVHYLNPAQPLEGQMPADCPITSLHAVPVYIVGGSTVLLGSEQLRQYVASQPKHEATVEAFQQQHRARQAMQARHGMEE